MLRLGFVPGLGLSSIKKPNERELTLQMGLSRLRLKLGGEVASSTLAYNVVLSADGGIYSFKDVWFDAALGSPSVWLRAGNLRRSFSRQMLTPYFRMTMPDRPLTEQVFTSGHDIGVMLHSGTKNEFEWSLSFLMGDYESPKRVGERLRRETPSKVGAPAESASVVVRLARKPKVGRMYDESDAKKQPFRWSVGLSAQALVPTKEEGRGALQGSVDVKIAARGWTLLGAFFVGTEQDDRLFESQAFQGAGYTLQTSVRMGSSIEPSLRFTHLVFPGSWTDIKDTSLGFSMDLYEGYLRWVSRLGWTIRDIEEGYRSDLTMKTQLQFWY